MEAKYTACGMHSSSVSRAQRAAAGAFLLSSRPRPPLSTRTRPVDPPAGSCDAVLAHQPFHPRHEQAARCHRRRGRWHRHSPTASEDLKASGHSAESKDALRLTVKPPVPVPPDEPVDRNLVGNPVEAKNHGKEAQDEEGIGPHP